MAWVNEPIFVNTDLNYMCMEVGGGGLTYHYELAMYSTD